MLTSKALLSCKSIAHGWVEVGVAELHVEDKMLVKKVEALEHNYRA